jgi:hypothetical protein
MKNICGVGNEVILIELPVAHCGKGGIARVYVPLSANSAGETDPLSPNYIARSSCCVCRGG